MKHLLIALLMPAALHAAETASFLNVGAGARAQGLGGAYSALADDSSSLYWNPAGMARLEKKEASASHAELFEGTRHDYLVYAHPTQAGVLGAALTYLSQNKIEGRDASGRTTGGYEASDSAFSFGYGRRTNVADVGLTAKYIRSHIGSAEAQTIAIDLGARKEFGAVLVGAAIRNMGPGLKYEGERNDLPLRLALGAAYKFSAGHAVSAELTNGPRGAGTEAGFGGEYQAVKNIFLRAGYTTRTVAGGSGFDAAKGLSLGVGLRNERFSLDYAVLPMGELGSSHRFSLAWRW